MLTPISSKCVSGFFVSAAVVDVVAAVFAATEAANVFVLVVAAAVVDVVVAFAATGVGSAVAVAATELVGVLVAAVVVVVGVVVVAPFQFQSFDIQLFLCQRGERGS